MPLLFVVAVIIAFLCGEKGVNILAMAIFLFPFLILILLVIMEPFRRRKLGYGWKVCLFGEPEKMLEDRRKAKYLRREYRNRRFNSP